MGWGGGGGAEGVRGLRVRLQMSLGFGDVWGLGFRVLGPPGSLADTKSPAAKKDLSFLKSKCRVTDIFLICREALSHCG